MRGSHCNYHVMLRQRPLLIIIPTFICLFNYPLKSAPLPLNSAIVFRVTYIHTEVQYYRFEKECQFIPSCVLLCIPNCVMASTVYSAIVKNFQRQTSTIKVFLMKLIRPYQSVLGFSACSSASTEVSIHQLGYTEVSIHQLGYTLPMFTRGLLSRVSHVL